MKVDLATFHAAKSNICSFVMRQTSPTQEGDVLEQLELGMNGVVSILENGIGAMVIKTIDTTLSIPFTVVGATTRSSKQLSAQSHLQSFQGQWRFYGFYLFIEWPAMRDLDICKCQFS